MVQRYVWWDDIEKAEHVRVEFRMPKAMREVLGEMAKKNGVSMNALGVGFLGYLLDADRRRKLRVDVRSSVHVSDESPADRTMDVPVQNITLGRRRSRRPPHRR